MKLKRCLATCVLATGLGFGSQAARAEDPVPPTPTDAPTAPKEAPKEPPKEAPKEKPKEEPKKKDPFFGDRFAMYLETRGGPASIDTVKNPVSSSQQFNSVNSVSFSGNKSGQFTLGWTLPRDRGQYLLTYTGIADGNYSLEAEGLQQSYVAQNGESTRNLNSLVPWWHVSVRDGQLRTTQTPPVWYSLTDDANGNGLPDASEMRYPTTTIDVSDTVPKDLGNRIQTWDLLYRREYGGLKIRARWTAGLRYLSVKGAMVTPSWLLGTPSDVFFGYSDGVVNKFILMQQSTTGVGPVGSGEVDFNFFRQRLTLYAGVQAAFLVSNLSTDSNDFTYFARDLSDVGFFLPGAGHIAQKVSKTTWNTAFEAGVRVKLLEGFHLIVDWNRTGYLDTLLLPTSISIPQNSAQVALGTTALFVSRDFVVSSLNLGLSFQF
jgi:hypothetical protein